MEQQIGLGTVCSVLIINKHSEKDSWYNTWKCLFRW